MDLTRIARSLSLGAMLGIAVLSAPAFADDQGPRWWEPMVSKMANKEGMVSKKDFMDMMGKKFDEMDKDKKGMLSKDDVMRIFGDKH